MTTLNKVRSNKAVNIVLVVALILSIIPASLLTNTQEAHAQTIKQAWGVSRETVVNYLKSHENDTFYLTTPYPTTSLIYNDNIWPNGAPRSDGYRGMNCVGFPLHVMRSLGVDTSVLDPYNPGSAGPSGLAAWYKYFNAAGITQYSFTSIEALLASGKAEKGDLVIFMPTDWSVPGADSHIGFFWGNSPSENLFWHSDSYGNRISGLTGKTSSNIITVYKIDESGKIDLIKESANPDMTNGNACYDLSGAVYSIFDANMNGVAEITTALDQNGNYSAISGDLTPGKYYVKEKTAPNGYLLDTKTYEVTVTSGNTVRVNGTVVKDTPANDPVGALIFKSDSETGEQVAQMGASLGKGQFTLNYYAGLYTIDGTNTGGSTPYVDDNPNGYEELPAGTEPTRTWVFETDEDGWVLFNDESYYIGGDPLYREAAGQATFPAGTYVQQETKAPTGYNLPEEPEKYLTRIIYDPSNTDGRIKNINGKDYWLPVNIDMEGNPLPEVGNEANLQSIQKEDVIRGDIAIYKYVEAETGDEHDSNTGSGVITTPEEGVEFDIYPESEYETVNGKPQLKDDAEELFTLVTDESGFASTVEGVVKFGGVTYEKGTGVYVSDTRAVDGTYTVRKAEDTDRGGVPFGIYLAVQKNASSDKVGIAAPFLINVSAENRTTMSVVRNTDEPSAIQVVKKDADSGLTVPYPATWSIKDLSTGELVSMVEDRTMQVKITEFTSNENGQLILPEKLAKGNYELIEVQAPAANGLGYLRNPVNVAFEVKEANDWTTPIVVTMIDEKPYGSVTLTKTDAGSEARGGVAGAVYELRAAADIVTLDGETHHNAGDRIGEYTTDENGQISADGLYLGKYYFVETSSPEGWVLDKTKHYFSLEYADQETAIVYATVEVAEAPTTIIVNKINNALEALSGAVFKLTKKGVEIYDVDALLEVMQETFVSEQNFDPDNTYSYDEAKLIQAIENLGDSEGKITVDLDVDPNSDNYPLQQAFITFNADKTITVQYRLISDITIDATNTADLEYTFETGEDGAGICEYLTHGEWILEEIQAPEGHEIGLDSKWEFTVAHDGSIINIPQPLTVVNEGRSISTYATAEDGTKVVPISEEAKVIDNAYYKGFEVGVEHTMFGQLMIKLKDSEGNYIYDEAGEIAVEPLEIDGELVLGKVVFTPEESKGYATIEFTFDSTVLEPNTELVVFEEVFIGEDPVTDHKDPSDEGQTVTIPEPYIHTFAYDKETGTKYLVASDNATIVDDVSVNEVVSNKIYRLVGTLMNKETFKPITHDGKDVIAIKDFEASESTFIENIEFTFNASDLAGATTVVFEELYEVTEDENGEEVLKLVAEHKDLEDIDQTVYIVEKGSPHDKTGNDLADSLLYILALLGISAVGIGTYGIRKNQLSKQSQTTDSE